MSRPREHYLASGPDPFGDAELTALLVGTGAGGRSALEIAADLLRRHGGLAGLARCDPGELAAVPGIGPARAVRLHAALEMGRRSLRHPSPAPVVDGPEAAARQLAPPLRGLAHEELHALYLDRRNRPVAHRRLTRGSSSYTVVDPRQVFRPAVQLGAAGVILAHNHPSGDPTPSVQDREVTRRTRRAGEVLGIHLVDHLVVAGDLWRRVDA